MTVETEERNRMEHSLSDIRARMREAEERSGNRDVLLIAAVKYTDAEHIRTLHSLGVRDVGENRVQQLLAHRESLADLDLRYHFIGRLQTNKVKYIIDKVCMIHSLDSFELAKEIEKQAAKKEIVMDVLAEINSGEEANKGGLMPAEVADFCLSLDAFPHLSLRGFMTMAPKCEKKEDSRKFFSKTFQQGIDIWQKKLHNIGSPFFSMGMSGTFDVAIEEGATAVRVGRALFDMQSSENIGFNTESKKQGG